MSMISFSFFFFIVQLFLFYFLVPVKFRWFVLLVFSYLFFWINSKWLLLVHAATTLITFGFAQWIASTNRKGKDWLQSSDALSREEKKAYKSALKKKTKHILILGIVLNLAALLFLKYYNFFAETVNPLLRHLGVTIPGLSLLLPIGISYYTLQAIAYMTDVYRGKIEPAGNVLHFMLFMSYFPQLIQGPIPRYEQLAGQLLEGHRFDYHRFTYGLQLILWGLIKKMIIADRLALPVNEIFDNFSSYSGLPVLFGAMLFTLQVYTDFSGGIDVVRGISQSLGIDLEVNFRQPFFSRSIEEFWRRWHITLGAWMRDYVFYPLSLSKTFGNLSKKARKAFGNSFGKKLPAFLAMFIVYFLVGFWHGSSWKYVAYGVWNGVFIMSGIMLGDWYNKARTLCGIEESSISWRVFQMIRTFLISSVGRIFSRAGRLKTAWAMILSIFHNTRDFSFVFDGSLLKYGLDTANWILLFIAILLLFMVDYIHERDISIRDVIAEQHLIFRWVIYLSAICAVLIFGIYGPGYVTSDFIYGQF